MNVETVKLDTLHADPANVRTHGERNLSAIAGSLKTFGQVEPLVVQKGTGKVIGGNGRLDVMRKMGLTECAIVEVDIDDTKAAALGIALNRTGELAEWDDAALGAMLGSLDADLRIAAGFDEGELAALLDGASVGGSPPSSTPMAERFGAPPFSVLDARQGYWQDRKRQWLALGIQSELGRGGGAWVESANTGSPIDRQNEYGERERAK